MKFWFFLAIFVFVGTFFVYGTFSFLYQSVSSDRKDTVQITIPEGSNVWDIASILKKKQCIPFSSVFVFGVWKDDLRGKFQAGIFDIPPALTVSEIAFFLTTKSSLREENVRITFPEGWTIAQMADHLEANTLPGKEFFVLAKKPDTFFDQFSFLRQLPQEATLEGFLFPDTYFFDPGASSEDIIVKMLQTFSKKVFERNKEIFGSEGENIFSFIIMASIIEGEVRSSEDRRLVSGIFNKRMESEMPLQSDATLAYVLEERKIQHSAQDLSKDSLYNTYKYQGLPPGPICNPSLDAIESSMEPTVSEYWFFLNDPKTGKTYFAKDFEEHKKNKTRVGL
ncbi:MAG: endolytic transglycosylase MltG [Candidatus Moranbacteria bacterium]|nr:endolytic transglycosylase MltG [Candidatus Moranbacteria bacterium]